MFFTKHNELVEENCRLRIRVNALYQTLEEVNHDKCMAMIELKGYKDRYEDLKKNYDQLMRQMQHITENLDTETLMRLINSK
jgi:predicted nuclease with TOPRIM domain